MVFFEGRIHIDNNLVENAIRSTALGKKNWLFLGDADAGYRSAILYTIIESCRARGSCNLLIYNQKRRLCKVWSRGGLPPGVEA